MKRLREDLHRYRFLLPCALAAVMLLRWAAMRGRPERIMELALSPNTQWVGVADGSSIVFGISGNGTDLVAYSRRLDGSGQRLLVRHPSSESEIGAFIAGRYLYYINVWYAERHATDTTAKADALPYLRRFSPSVPPSMPGGEVAKPGVLGLLAQGTRGRFSDRVRTTLHRVPLSGGPPEEIRLDTSGPNPVFANLCVVNDCIFWTRRRELTKAELTKAARSGRASGGDPFPPAWHELFVTPASGGRATRLHAGIFQYARLIPSTDGAYWRVVESGRRATTDLVHASAETRTATVRKDTPFDAASLPVVCNGRVYWINDVNGGGFGMFANVSRRDLVSARPDGSDIRVVAGNQPEKEAIPVLTKLYVYRDRLYGTLLEERSTGSESGRYRHFLCEIQPDRDQPITKLTPLPRRMAERGVFDDGYYYFVVNERSESLFDWNGDDGATPERFFLNRLKLPEPGAT